MMVQDKRRYIGALSDLAEYVHNKRLNLVENSVPALSYIHKEIIKDIKRTTRLDFFDAVENEDLIEKIENTLDDKFNEATDTIAKYDLADELFILDHSTEKNPSSIKDLPITISQPCDDLIKQTGLSHEEVISIFKKPTQVYSVELPRQKKSIYFITCSHDYKNTPCNFFFHISSIGQMHSVIITKEDITENFSPVRLFLNILDWYGVVFRVNKKSKKLFLNESLSGNINIDLPGGKRHYIGINEFVSPEAGSNVTTLNLGYLVNISKYRLDLKHI